MASPQILRMRVCKSSETACSKGVSVSAVEESVSADAHLIPNIVDHLNPSVLVARQYKRMHTQEVRGSKGTTVSAAR